jgi:hypothetical protein
MTENMRGIRLGRQSLESDKGVELAQRISVHFRCLNNHEFEIPFAHDAEMPQTWDCARCSAVAIRLEGGVEIETTGLSVEEHRTHFDMVLERRSREELEELLEEMLSQMRDRRARGRLTA